MKKELWLDSVETLHFFEKKKVSWFWYLSLKLFFIIYITPINVFELISCKSSKQWYKFFSYKNRSELRGPSPIFIFFYQSIFRKFAHNLWNWIKNQFLLKVLFFSWLSHFLGKKTPFSPSTKKNRSLWVFIAQVWLTYQYEAKAMRKRNSALFFLV